MASSLIFLTGGTGHVGFRTLVQALKYGYRVRMAVRHEEQEKQIIGAASIKPHLARLEFVLVEDMVAPNAYNHVLKDVIYVLHLAFPKTDPTEDFEASVVQPAVRPVLSLLRAASLELSIKRVVITSSMIAIIPWRDFAMRETDRVYTDVDINPKLSDQPADNMQAYGVAKTLALHAANEFMASLGEPHFDIIHNIPSFVVGRNELVTDYKNIVRSSNVAALGPILGQKFEQPFPSASVHLDDVAAVHVRALNPAVQGNQNFIASSLSLSGTVLDDGLEFARKHFPTDVESGTLPLGGHAPTHRVYLDAQRTERELGVKFQGYENQVVDIVGQYVELRRQAREKGEVHM